MIIKCISRKSNVSQLIKYVLKDEKIATHKQSKPIKYVAGRHLTKEDIRHLESEKSDATLRDEFKAFKGSVQEFIKSLIAKGDDLGLEPKTESIIIKNNIRSRSVNGYIREFEKNESFRQHTRINSVLAYHHIISFNKLDSPNINEKMLKDIARQYMSVRGINNLYVGAVHNDRDHIHIHLIQSGVQYYTGIANRVSKQQFQAQKEAMQQYQRQRYPFLLNSLPEHGKSKGGRIFQNSLETKNITPERSLDKNILLGLLETNYASARSSADFLTRLQDMGHIPYYRNGRLQGVKFEGERKFRLNRLGYDEKKLQELDSKKEKGEKSLHELRQLRIGRAAHPAKENNSELLKQHETLQELVNKQKEFETKQDLSEGDQAKLLLLELQDIRGHQGKEIERSDTLEQNGRDSTDDKTTGNSRDDTRDSDQDKDEDTDEDDTDSPFNFNDDEEDELNK